MSECAIDGDFVIIAGYRRLRTLSQLLFETLPQLLLQAWVWYQLNTNDSDPSLDDLRDENTIDSLFVSIGFAIFHLVFEAMIIYLDSQACDMSFFHYGLQCLGARMEWGMLCCIDILFYFMFIHS